MASRSDASGSAGEARSIQFLAHGPRIPLDLIRARDAGDVVFIVGAGASKKSGLPLFWELTRQAYFDLTGRDLEVANQVQRSVAKAYEANAFDFVLGHLEREIDGGQLDGKRPRRVRRAVAEALAASANAPLDRHLSLLILARDQRGEPRVVTTNFDTLLERAWQNTVGLFPLISRAGADLPGPGTVDFNGVLHLHGRLSDESLPPELTATDLVLTDADFGDAYLRSGWAARFLYDLVRRYTLVLVGYGAEDPPLKYLLSVIGADRSRFSDLKPIYAFAHSAASEADDVTGEWLAKGVSPLLYEPGREHEPLYDTLAEWAHYVDDPAAWADARLRTIGSRHYDELENHERSLLELVLLSPTNCTRAKAAGADFSLIRAIEASRPATVFDNDGMPGFRGAADSYLNPLIAWIWSSIASLDAVAWAVARQAQYDPISMLKDDVMPSAKKAEPRRITEIRGFSDEELAIIRRQYRYNYKDWPRGFAAFWYLFLLAYEGRRADQPEMAYEILQRLERFADEPLLGDAKQLAEFMAPRLQISHPIHWGSELSEITSPFQLANFRNQWNKHPGHNDIAAALPNNTSWLKYFLHYLENEITALYALTQQIDGDFGSAWLSTACHSVASDPGRRLGGVFEDEGWTDPDPYSSDHIPLVRLTSAAYRRLRELDSKAARQVASRWSIRDERIFIRLYLWAMNDDELWTSAEIVDALENIPDDPFWRPDPEAVLVMVHQWKRVPPDTQRRLEQRILNPPVVEDIEPERASLIAQWYKHTAADMVLAISKRGNKLSDDAYALLEGVRKAGGEPKGLAGLVSRSPRVVSIPPAEAGSLVDLDGDELLTALLADLQREDLSAGSLTDAVIKSKSFKVFEALAATSIPATGKLWRRLYSFYALHQSDADPAHEMRSALLQLIQELPSDVLSEAVHAAADWMEKITVGTDDSIMPFLKEKQGLIFNSWRHLANYAFRTGEKEHFSSNQGERLMSQAFNRPAGVLAFIGIALADRGARHPAELPVLAEVREDIDAILCRVGEQSRALVAARISQWLGLCERLLPDAAERLVLAPLLSEHPDLSLLDLHLLFGHGTTQNQYRRLEPLLINEAKNGSLSQQGNQRNIESLIWRSLDKLAGLHDGAPDNPAMRSILQRTTAENRTSVARVCRTWFLKQDANERAKLWDRVGEPFFKSVWPLDAALRHPAVSQELLRLPPVFTRSFERVVEHMVTLIVPFQLYDIRSMFIGLMDGGNYEELKGLARSFISDHWSAFLNMLDAALGASPSTTPHDLAEWLDDLSRRAPAAQVDPRFKRLLRLTQR